MPIQVLGPGTAAIDTVLDIDPAMVAAHDIDTPVSTVVEAHRTVLVASLVLTFLSENNNATKNQFAIFTETQLVSKLKFTIDYS